MNRFSSGEALLCISLVFISTGFVSASSHDASWVFGNSGSFSYILNSYEPSESQLGTPGSSNPTLTLRLNRRYQVKVTNYSFHPFEVLAKGALAGGDTVLLSMAVGVTGTFEGDGQVDWVDNGSGTVTFTLTLDLYNAMATETQGPGYRCRPHASTMRGDFVVLGLPLSDPIPEKIQKGRIGIELETVASGMAAPVDLVEAPDGSGRLFVLDQPGQIWIIDDGQLNPVAFLDISDRVHMPGIFGSQDAGDYDERGLLGFALHPGFGEVGSPGYQKIFTYSSEIVGGLADFTTEPLPAGISFDHQSVIAEWTVKIGDSDSIDVATRREILRVDQPQFNHNGGKLSFGPDGYLYIAFGDGGDGDDTGDGHGLAGNGQNINTVHGSILRIDPLDPAVTVSVDPVSANGQYRVPIDNPFMGSEGIDEIYAYGFRNAWRFGFDRLTGMLIAGDVGQNSVEEIDIVSKGGNYGWNLKEGSFRFDAVTGSVSDDLVGLPGGMIDPVAQYDHDEGISITGGFVYRGTQIPELIGKYVFGDFSTGFFPADGRLFHADLDTGLIEEFVIGVDDRVLGLYIKGFGEDAEGIIYVLAGSDFGPFGTGGVVLKIVDLCSSRIAGDINNDCVVNLADIATLGENWLQSALR